MELLRAGIKADMAEQIDIFLQQDALTHNKDNFAAL
jgi:hypothetical protein